MKKEGNFYQIPNRLMKNYGKTIKPRGIALYNALALHADREGVSYPSELKIRSVTGMDVKTIRKARKVLMDIGIISGKRIKSKGGKYSHYVFKLNHRVKNHHGKIPETTGGKPPTNNTHINNTQYKEIKDFFYLLVEKKRGVRLVPSLVRDRTVIKRFLKSADAVDYKEVMKHYLSSEKSKHHISLPAALSPDTINRYRLEKKKNDWR